MIQVRVSMHDLLDKRQKWMNDKNSFCVVCFGVRDYSHIIHWHQPTNVTLQTFCRHSDARPCSFCWTLDKVLTLDKLLTLDRIRIEHARCGATHVFRLQIAQIDDKTRAKVDQTQTNKQHPPTHTQTRTHLWKPTHTRSLSLCTCASITATTKHKYAHTNLEVGNSFFERQCNIWCCGWIRNVRSIDVVLYLCADRLVAFKKPPKLKCAFCCSMLEY